MMDARDDMDGMDGRPMPGVRRRAGRLTSPSLPPVRRRTSGIDERVDWLGWLGLIAGGAAVLVVIGILLFGGCVDRPKVQVAEKIPVTAIGVTADNLTAAIRRLENAMLRVEHNQTTRMRGRTNISVSGSGGLTAGLTAGTMTLAGLGVWHGLAAWRQRRRGRTWRVTTQLEPGGGRTRVGGRPGGEDLAAGG